MSVEFYRADSASIKEDAITLFMEQQGTWGSTRDEYRAIWDWRSRGLSDGETIHYVARATGSGAIVGHIAAYRRRFWLNGTELQIAVVGNLLVHREWRGNIVGVRLVRFARDLVARGEFDAVLSFGNDIAYALFLRLGFHDLRVTHTYADVWNVTPILRRRYKLAGIAGPAINVALALRRKLLSSLGKRVLPHAQIRSMTATEFLRTDRSHWTATNRLISADTPEFVVRRYLESPVTHRRLFGLFSHQTAAFEGYVITEGIQRLQVWDCQVNPQCLTAPGAIASVAASLDEVESILVPTLPQSDLARELIAAGFVDRHDMGKGTYLSAYWQPDHPRAPQLADLRRWNIWIGSSHW